MTSGKFKSVGLSVLALLLTGCYTQLAVVERPVPVYASGTGDQLDRNIAERAETDEYFDEVSYRDGYEDAIKDYMFRDYNRRPVFNSSEYELGYRDGYSDANWHVYRDRFRYRYHTHWSPVHYSSYWAFYVGWHWHRPYAWYGYYGYSPYAYYTYPHFYYGHGWMGYGYYGPYRPHTWIVYTDGPRNNNIHRGPRNSGVSRDLALTEPRHRAVRSGDRVNSNTTRTSGVARENTTTRDRGTVTNNGRTTNPRNTSVRQPATERTTQARPSSSGRTNVRSTPSSGNNRSGSGSGSVGSSPRPSSSGSGSSGNRPPRPNNRNNNDDALSAGATTVVPRYAIPQPNRETPEVRVRNLRTVSDQPSTSRSSTGSIRIDPRDGQRDMRPTVNRDTGFGVTATERSQSRTPSTAPLGNTVRRVIQQTAGNTTRSGSTSVRSSDTQRNSSNGSATRQAAPSRTESNTSNRSRNRDN